MAVRRTHVDTCNAAVRVLAPHERHVQHAGKLHVVDEQRASGQQPRVLVARDAGAKVAGARLARLARLDDVLVAGAAAEIRRKRVAHPSSVGWG